MKIFLAAFFLFFSFNSFSYLKELPKIPDDCFLDSFYCSDWKILKRNHPKNPWKKRVIRLRFFAKLDSYLYPGANAVMANFLDFPRWIEYAEYTDQVSFLKSLRLKSRVGERGNVILRHFAQLEMKGPRIIGGKVRGEELCNYTKIDTLKNAETSWTFWHDPRYRHKGIKHKTGDIHITYDDENENFYFMIVMDVIPEVDLLPKVAAPYIERGTTALFVGMFDLF